MKKLNNIEIYKEWSRIKSLIIDTKIAIVLEIHYFHGEILLYHISIKENNIEDATQCIQMEDKHSTLNMTTRIQNKFEFMRKFPNFDYKWSIVKLVLSTFKYEIITIILFG